MGLDQNIKSKLLQKVPASNDIWADYQCDLNTWNSLKSTFVDSGLISLSDIGPQPVFSDYTDLASEKSRCLE